MEKNHINHNLQNDLAIVLGLLYKIKKMEVNKDVLVLVNKIQDKVMKTSKTFQDVLNPKKEVSFKDSFLKAETDLNIFFNGNDLKVKANVRKFDMLIDNIIKNAKEAKAKTIKISGSNKGIIIRDDGIGLSEDALSKINSDEIFSTKVKGTGLGTAFIKEFCKTHGMSVFYANNFTKGCQITINTS